MYWIALLPSHDEHRTSWGWRALQFTPRVAFVDEAIVLEASACLKLWGGRQRLAEKLFQCSDQLGDIQWAEGRSSLAALAMLRLRKEGKPRPRKLPDDFPLETLTPALEHLPVLERIGCRTWGDLRSLPRGGVSRRFGAGLLSAIDAAFGQRSEGYPWIELPEDFDMRVELAALATSAPELMWSANRLLTQLQVWLQARHRGVTELELEWTLDLRRLNGILLPSHEQLAVRTAQPTQDIVHLRRLVGEHLERTHISAPASYLRLRTLQTHPWGGISKSLLPEDNLKGERLHQFVERVSVRLGERSVVVPQPVADHRPERMQKWIAARNHAVTPFEDKACDAIYPTWLLPEPVPLKVKQHVPHYGGPLQRLTRLYRMETGWWEGGESALRDYFIARSEEAGWVWIYRERPQQLSSPHDGEGEYAWFLQGIYA